MDRIPDERIPDSTAEIPRVTIEMGGDNIVIRSTAEIDHECTAALTHAVNAAADTHTVVVIDPDPIRCDDSFASSRFELPDAGCVDHAHCRPVDVAVVARGVIRIAAEHTSWTVDLMHGRFCRADSTVDVHFVDPAGWTPIVAICVTPTSVSALTVDGTLVTSKRAHGDRMVAR